MTLRSLSSPNGSACGVTLRGGDSRQGATSLQPQALSPYPPPHGLPEGLAPLPPGGREGRGQDGPARAGAEGC